MCTPQFQQAVQLAAQQRAADAGISPEDAAANGGQYGVMPSQPTQLSPSMMASIQNISEMFDPATGRRIQNVGPSREVPMVPITKAEFDGVGGVPVNMIHESISSIPRNRAAPIPNIPLERIQRQPTVGELLGIKPGSVTEVGGPGRF
jgi:hypothetical protein